MGTEMSKVSVRFFDDEMLEGKPQDIDFDEADFLLKVEDPSGLDNNELAWIPLSAVKWIEFPTQKNGGSESPTRKVAIRFLDGEVLRGHIDGALERHRYGILLNFHPEDGKSPVRRLGVPFSAVKALFYLREFDGRGKDGEGIASDSYLARRTMAPLLDVLEEMDMLTKLHQGGVLSDEEYQAKRTQVLEEL
jgi:hypothetical protein